MNATEDVNWLDIPSVLDATVERLKAVKALGLNAGLDFHGRLHRPMAKQLAKALEPHRPLFIEEPILVEHPEALKQLSDMTSIPIALGERLYHRWDAKRFFEDGLIDILQPDIAHAGSCYPLQSLLNHELTLLTRWHLRDKKTSKHGRSLRRRYRTTLPSRTHSFRCLSSRWLVDSQLRHPRNVTRHALQRRSRRH